MNYEQRKSGALIEITRFLNAYAPPSGTNEAAQEQIIQGISEAFARHLPVGNPDQYRADIETVLQKVADTRTSYVWPPQGVFVEQMKGLRVSQSRPQETFKADGDDRDALRMNAGDPVGEESVWGGRATRLLNSGAVSREVMDRYRRGSAEAYRRVYRDDAQLMHSRRWGTAGWAYFNQGAAE